MPTTSIGDMHDDITYVGPSLLMVLLNHPSHRKCIGFADLQVNFLLQNLQIADGAMKFQEQLNYEISNKLIANLDYLVSDCCIDGA